MFYAYDGERLYFQSHPGMKDDFMAGTQSACFLVVEMLSADDWASVQVHGHVERATLTDDAFKALEAMMKNPFPPELSASDKGAPKRSAEKMYIGMLTPKRIAGRFSHKHG